jgi:hypothetical protein
MKFFLPHAAVEYAIAHTLVGAPYAPRTPFLHDTYAAPIGKQDATRSPLASVGGVCHCAPSERAPPGRD